MAVPLLGVSWWVEQMEVMEVFALARCGKR